MSDDLALPAIPEGAPDDPEDVSWALSTAEAMWARGDHLEGIKWVRRAAEAAAEAERDGRALELAKVAAELSGVVARLSQLPSAETVETAVPTALSPSVRPPPVLPSQVLAQTVKPSAPRPGRSSPPPRGEPKTKIRSRDNMTAVPPPAPLPDDTAEMAADRSAPSGPVSRKPPVPAPPGSVTEIASSEMKSAEDWDASPTQNLTSDELAKIGMPPEERKTAVGAAPGPIRPPMTTQHDPEIKTSQAVRVVVWRDASGVHLAPEGTRVSAITIDAVLVALEPSADLTAWLSRRD